MTTRRVVFLDRETLPPAVTVRDPSFEHAWTQYDRTAPSEVVERIMDADIVITNKVRVRGEHLTQCPGVKVIAVSATGTDNVDLDYCRENGIVVTNIREYAMATVPEHTFALILGLMRSVRPYHHSVAAGRWAEAGQFCYFDYPVFNLRDKVLGIVGRGTLGQAVAKIAEGFGMDVRFAARKGAAEVPDGYTPFDTILAESDIITFHCPLTNETRDMIGDAEFDVMTKRPILINTARGGLVDEQALVRALDAGKIAGAGFDVVTTEPMPDDHPFLGLMDRPDFILTPHVGWASMEAIQGLADQLIDNIEAAVAGDPRNVVAP